MLSEPPRWFASSTSCVDAVFGSADVAIVQDLVVGDVPGDPVRAEQQPVAGLERLLEQVGLDRGALPEAAGDRVPPRMPRDVLRPQPPLAHLFGRQRVIARDLADRPRPDHVGAAIAGRDDPGRLAPNHGRHDGRGVRARRSGRAVRPRPEDPIRRVDRGHQQAAGVNVLHIPAGPQHRLDGQPRRVPSGAETADAVGDDPDRRFVGILLGDERAAPVLVDRAHPAEIGKESAIDLERHRATEPPRLTRPAGNRSPDRPIASTGPASRSGRVGSVTKRAARDEARAAR